MIIEYTHEGFITHIVNDPVPSGLEEALLANGRQFISYNERDESGAPLIDVDIMDHYIANGQILGRPEIDAPDTLTLQQGQRMVISNLPTPCRIFVDADEVVIEDGQLEIEGEIPAEYQIYFDQWPYKPKLMQVTISEA